MRTKHGKYKSPSCHNLRHMITNSYGNNTEIYVGFTRIKSTILNSDLVWSYQYVCNGCKR
jgi:hypothetical protein